MPAAPQRAIDASASGPCEEVQPTDRAPSTKMPRRGTWRAQPRPRSRTPWRGPSAGFEGTRRYDAPPPPLTPATVSCAPRASSRTATVALVHIEPRLDNNGPDAGGVEAVDGALNFCESTCTRRPCGTRRNADPDPRQAPLGCATDPHSTAGMPDITTKTTEASLFLSLSHNSGAREGGVDVRSQGASVPSVSTLNKLSARHGADGMPESGRERVRNSTTAALSRTKRCRRRQCLRRSRVRGSRTSPPDAFETLKRGKLRRRRHHSSSESDPRTPILERDSKPALIGTCSRSRARPPKPIRAQMDPRATPPEPRMRCRAYFMLAIVALATIAAAKGLYARNAATDASCPRLSSTGLHNTRLTRPSGAPAHPTG